MTSDSLILVGNVNGTLQIGGDGGAVIRRGVGLTVDQFMRAGGKIVTRTLNIGYSGPYDPQRHIHQFFSEAERESALDELYKADWGNPTKQHKKLLNHCRDLLRYALPECTIATQLVTFKILVVVITQYPGLRRLFHHPKCSKKTSPLTASDFENLWNRPHQQCGEEWTFYRDFAAYCLTESGPPTKLVESELPSKFGQLKLLEDNWNKDPIEILLSFGSADSPLDLEKLCAIRYLAGILERPKFWRLKTEGGIDIGKRFFGFLSRLCESIFQLIQDTEPSVADKEDDSSSLWTSACSAVDILAFATFGGFLQLHGLHGERLPCPSQLPSIVSFLIRPEMERNFPKASGCAPRVKDIINWQQNAGTDSLHIPPDSQPPPLTPPFGDPQPPLTPRFECTGFPTGKFRIRAVGTQHYWTPTRWNTHQDGNTVHIWSLGGEEPQGFFVNSKGNLSCGSSGAELDVMGNALITTLNRQRTEPWPNPWSHPLPTFSYSEESKMITIKFYADPVVSDHWPRAESEWREKGFALAARSVVGTVIPSFQEIARWAPDSVKSTIRWADSDSVGFERPAHQWDNLGVEEIGENMEQQDLDRMYWEIERL